MAPLPRPFSRAASIVESAISEGRAEEAMHKLVAALRTGDDRATRWLAADWIERLGLRPGDAKALRDGKKALPEEWLDISEMVEKLQSEGSKYEQAVKTTAKHLGYSERHVQKCVAEWRAAKEAAREDEAARES